MNYITKIGDKLYQDSKYIPALQREDTFSFYFPEVDVFRNHSLFGRLDFTGSIDDPDGDVYRRMAFRVIKCDPEINSTCKPYKNNLYLSFWFNNHHINVSSLNET